MNMVQSQARFNDKPLKRIVVKIGSSLLTNNGKGLDRKAIYGWATQIAKLQNAGMEVVLVSSGSIAEGVVKMNLDDRPKKLPALQACAAIGQMGLIETWWSALMEHSVQSAQVLLTHDDLSNRNRYLNTASTLNQLIDWQVIPVINENDTISVDEIKFGDNDTLGAMAANMAKADLYVILTDQQGVFTDNPRNNPDAKMISQERAMADYLFDIAGDGGKLGSGGMLTKIRAARLAAMGGCPTVIVSGTEDDVITKVVAGQPLGTLLTTNEQDKIIAKKQWLATHLQLAGSLVVDAGAATAITQNHKSLLPVGVKRVHGNFVQDDVVAVIHEVTGERIAVGQVSFGSGEALAMVELNSAKDKTNNAKTDAKVGKENIAMIHRDKMAVLG